jgi:hypothetical protein
LSASLKLVDGHQGTFDAALEIAQRRADTLRELREALVSNDEKKALSLARKVCGLDDKASSGANKSKH